MVRRIAIVVVSLAIHHHSGGQCQHTDMLNRQHKEYGANGCTSFLAMPTSLRTPVAISRARGPQQFCLMITLVCSKLTAANATIQLDLW